jgi:hypothetical protein
MRAKQIHKYRLILSATETQTDDNVISIDGGKHSNVKDNVVVTASTSTPSATVFQSNV